MKKTMKQLAAEAGMTVYHYKKSLQNTELTTTELKEITKPEDIYYKEQKVITTKIMAEILNVPESNLTNNYNRNKEKFEEGKHHFKLEGEEKNDFIDLNQIDLSSKNSKEFYLWTERGFFNHVKMINSDSAWNIYDSLVNTYFRTKEITETKITLKPQSSLDILQGMLDNLKEAEKNINRIEDKFDNRINKLIDTTKNKVNDIQTQVNTITNNLTPKFPNEYTAQELAIIFNIYSDKGKPHAMFVSALADKTHYRDTTINTNGINVSSKIYNQKFYNDLFIYINKLNKGKQKITLGFRDYNIELK